MKELGALIAISEASGMLETVEIPDAIPAEVEIKLESKDCDSKMAEEI